MGKREPGPPIDHGYAWVVVAACHVLAMFSSCILRTTGIILVEILEEFPNVSSAIIFTMVSTRGGALTLISPFANALSRRYGARRVVMVGGLITGIGTLSTAFATRIEHVIICYGGLAGLGLGLCLGPSLVTVAQYFDKRRALANGIALSGGSVGAFIMPPLLRILLDTYSVRGAMLLIGGLVLHICISGALYRPLSSWGKAEPTSAEEAPMLDNADENHQDEIKMSKSVVNPMTKIMLERSLSSEPKVKQQVQNGKHLPLLLTENYDNGANVYASVNNIALDNSHLTSDLPRRHTADSTLLKRPKGKKSKSVNKSINKHETFLYGSDISLAVSITNIQADQKDITSQTEKSTTTTDKPKSLCSRIYSLFAIELKLLKNATFLTFLTANLLGNFAYFNITIFIPANADDVGIPKLQVALLVSVLGGVDLVCRLFLGWFADLGYVKRVHILGTSCFIVSMCAFAAPYIHSFASMAVFCAVFGGAGAPWIFLRNVVQVDLFGIGLLSNVIGLSMASNAIPLLAGPPVVGWLRDVTGSYKWPFRCCGITMILGSMLLFFAMPIAQRYQKRKEEKQQEAKGIEA